MKEQQRKIQIKLDQDKAQGEYANIANIFHNQSEFVIDFAKIMPGVNFAKVVSRVIMTPRNIKAFLKSVEENIKKYESNFGEINLEKSDNKRIGF